MKTALEMWDSLAYMHDFHQRISFTAEHYHKQFITEPSQEQQLRDCLGLVVNHKFGRHGSQNPSWEQIISIAKSLLNKKS